MTNSEKGPLRSIEIKGASGVTASLELPRKNSLSSFLTQRKGTRSANEEDTELTLDSTSNCTALSSLLNYGSKF